jgi:hypothetical protein
MSTRGIIAWPEKTMGWEGVYHHWDSYPSGLGKALWHSLHGHFAGDVGAMLQVLIVEHPAGWSTILSDTAAPCADWTQVPGFVNPTGDVSFDTPTRPQCYCHGDRSDPARRLVTGLGAHAVGMFGSNPGVARWRQCAVIDLDGPEPSWETM